MTSSGNEFVDRVVAGASNAAGKQSYQTESGLWVTGPAPKKPESQKNEVSSGPGTHITTGDINVGARDDGMNANDGQQIVNVGGTVNIFPGGVGVVPVSGSLGFAMATEVVHAAVLVPVGQSQANPNDTATVGPAAAATTETVSNGKVTSDAGTPNDKFDAGKDSKPYNPFTDGALTGTPAPAAANEATGANSKFMDSWNTAREKVNAFGEKIHAKRKPIAAWAALGLATIWIASTARYQEDKVSMPSSGVETTRKRLSVAIPFTESSRIFGQLNFEHRTSKSQNNAELSTLAAVPQLGFTDGKHDRYMKIFRSQTSRDVPNVSFKPVGP